MYPPSPQSNCLTRPETQRIETLMIPAARLTVRDPLREKSSLPDSSCLLCCA